jgi:acyl transferase domain-containing protein/acyl carrier protein
MGHKLLGIDKNQLFTNSSRAIEVESRSNQEIAIIGISGKFAGAANVEEFWEGLRAGKDFVQAYPATRRHDSDVLVNIWQSKDRSHPESEYSEGAYFPEIGQFDPQLFNISPAEAGLMDPNQRIFLETVWAALEDAGYGGNKLSGTKTGVFVGHSNDFGYDYRYLINLTAPSQVSFSVPGNIQSIIASRISYLLDFKGPSIVVNTACSSALTAVHLACRSIRSGECELAVAGGVKVTLAPLKASESEGGIRILAPDGRARTFDDSSDGTGVGEGAGAVLLKPLSRALRDGDQIYAVIKGSAVNQDGNSIGITAPNSAAQEELILQAWQDADIPPETISYIEAHGTGTKLGDPIEISGIQKAFRHYTDKNQFCAVASVKTNVGHLDHAAGIVALIKAVLALKHKQLPPSLHFARPNRKINFTETPVYVNDKLRNWETNGSPRRCGVSSFGLSGTNCHLVLEEAPAGSAKNTKPDNAEAYILALSAKNATALHELVKQYRKIMIDGLGAGLRDLCYTANTGRGHYEHRLAIVFNNEAELQEKMAAADQTPASVPEKGIFYASFKLITTPKAKLMAGEINEEQRRSLTREAGSLLSKAATAPGHEKGELLRRIGALYVNGAEVHWEELYRGETYQKISLPVYPFMRKRFWCEPEIPTDTIDQSLQSVPGIHPLLESCLAKTQGLEIYMTRFSPRRHWVLSEHKIAGNSVVPGTTYLEMAAEIGRRHYPGMALELRDVFFMTPLIVNEDETKEVQTVIKLESSHLGFAVISQADDGIGWVTHAEGKIYGLNPPERSDAELAKVMAEFKTDHQYQFDGGSEAGGAIETGPRWKSLQKIYFDNQRALAYFELKPEYTADLLEYQLHPALMDAAVNVGAQSSGAGLYLPFSYRSLKVYKPLPGKAYCYLCRHTQAAENQETIAFDITLWDESGGVVAGIENYIIKKVPEESFKVLPAAGPELYHDIGWIMKPLLPGKQRLQLGLTLIFHDQKGIGAAICHELQNAGIEVIEVKPGQDYRQVTANQFIIGGMAEDYQKLCSAIQDRGLSRIIHLSALTVAQDGTGGDYFAAQQKNGLDSLFHLTRGLIHNKIRGPVSLALIADCVNEVTKAENRLNPVHAAFFGLGKVIGQEHEQLQCRSIDIDDQLAPALLLEEIMSGEESRVAYRDGNRYVEEFRQADLSKVQPQITEINDQGVYVITGGTGGLGLEIGKYLASKHKVNLCLLNRSPFPARESWPEILLRNEDRKLCRKLKAIQAIEANGSEVSIDQADVTAGDTLNSVLSALRLKFGRIRGIVHCAGVAGDGFIFRKEPHHFEQVINPKIKGTLILDELTQNDPLDFLVLFSSINAFLGGPGQGDYTAANAFLDSFTAYRNKRGARTLAINWPAWKETGMAVDYGVQNQEGVFKALPTATALKAFDEVLNLDLGRVIIGELDYKIIAAHQTALDFALSPQLAASIHRKAKMPGLALKTGKRKSVAEVVIKGKEAADFNGLEQKIAQIWAEVLGLEEVDIHDNFYHLGGDSILATRLLKEMEKEYSGLIDITDIFTYQTVTEMAAYLERKLRPESKPKPNISSEDDIDRILMSLAKGEITAEQADQLINLKR